MVVRILAELEIRPENVASFNAALLALGEGVRRNQMQWVLSYECFSADDRSLDCVIHEAYKDQEAFLNHLDDSGDAIAEFMKYVTVSRLTVTGEIPQEVLDQFKQFAGKGLRYFPKMISTPDTPEKR
jgi:quinol monooxygenase YgiN